MGTRKEEGKGDGRSLHEVLYEAVNFKPMPLDHTGLLLYCYYTILFKRRTCNGEMSWYRKTNILKWYISNKLVKKRR